MNISRGKISGAVRIGIYGTEGVGKTTFASKLPNPVFIDTEGSTNQMDVTRFDPPKSLEDVSACVDYVIQHPEACDTLVIDTVDSLEKLVFRAVVEENQLKNIEGLPYGKGYVYAKDKVQKLLDKLDQVIRNGVNVCLVCHSAVKKFELPDEMGSYDRYMLKLNEKNIAPLIKEWVDLLLFVNYRTDIIEDKDGKVKKGRGGQKRIMYTTHNACWDAKNRFGLPDEMPFEVEKIAHIFTGVEKASAPDPRQCEPEKPEIVPPKAEVTTTDKVPATKKAAKKREKPKDRPNSMKSDDAEKDALLLKLWNLMLDGDVYDACVIQAVVAEKGYYDLKTDIKDYDRDFIEGCLIEAWDAVYKLASSKMYDLPF